MKNGKAWNSAESAHPKPTGEDAPARLSHAHGEDKPHLWPAH